MSQLGHFRPIDNVYAMSAYPPTAVELSQRSEPPLRARRRHEPAVRTIDIELQINNRGEARLVSSLGLSNSVTRFDAGGASKRRRS